MCQRVSAALEGREEVLLVGLRLQMLWGFGGFLKAEGAGGQEYLGQGSLVLRHGQSRSPLVPLKAFNICSVEMRFMW